MKYIVACSYKVSSMESQIFSKSMETRRYGRCQCIVVAAVAVTPFGKSANVQGGFTMRGVEWLLGLFFRFDLLQAGLELLGLFVVGGFGFLRRGDGSVDVGGAAERRRSLDFLLV